MDRQLNEQEQSRIIKEVEEKYSKFLDLNFDANVFLDCRNNFALTSHIESIKIFEMDNLPNNPTFTIAIPTYNRHKTIKDAIDSALKQETSESYEVIVVENVDDFNIKTETQEMLEREYRGKLTYYKNKKNIGMFENWNRCLTLARGHWVCILHSDDILLASYLSHMKGVINKKPKSILVGNLMVSDKSFLKRFYSKIKKIDNMFFKLPIRRPPPSALLHHKTRCIEIGGYNGDFFPSDDMFFVCRCRKFGEIYTYRKKLHTKRNQISTESQPKTQLECSFIDVAFLLYYITPRFFANIVAKQQLCNYRNGLLKNKNFLLAEKIDWIIQEKITSNLSFGEKIFKLIYVILRYINKK